MAANRRKQDDKNLEILRELISINGNKYCLDCNQRGPTYVNTTIGSFVCSKCSGMLRGITPPHRVKSISMATFTSDEIEFIKSRGNDYCRRVWLGLYEGESVNYADEQSVRDFMSAKYEKKRYYLEQQASNTVTNGNSSLKSKSKSKSGSISTTSPLISIPPLSKPVGRQNLNTSTNKIVNNLLPISATSQNLVKVTNNFTQPFVTNNANIPSVPDFPVDFSTADIYNSSQYQVSASSTTNNNVMALLNTSTASFNAFTVPTPSSNANDRYAALADLDLALRQQKIKNMEEPSIESRNPFQSSTTNDIFSSNKNPFWGSPPPPLSVNPFMEPSNNGNYVNNKNPFL